jgi:hypothetical protein
VVSFTLWLFYPHGKSLRNPLDRKMCRPQNLVERCRELINIFSEEEEG